MDALLKSIITQMALRNEPLPILPEVSRLLRKKREMNAVREALSLGFTDENRLADMVFLNRHPERKSLIDINEPDALVLAAEWRAIRKNPVRSTIAARQKLTKKPPTVSHGEQLLARIKNETRRQLTHLLIKADTAKLCNPKLIKQLINKFRICPPELSDEAPKHTIGKAIPDSPSAPANFLSGKKYKYVLVTSPITGNYDLFVALTVNHSWNQHFYHTVQSGANGDTVVFYRKFLPSGAAIDEENFIERTRSKAEKKFNRIKQVLSTFGQLAENYNCQELERLIGQCIEEELGRRNECPANLQ